MTLISKKLRRTAFAFLMFVLSSPAWADVKVHGETGHRDPESFVRQQEQLTQQGIRV